MISNKVRFHKLDGLRGVLSLLIVLFHYDSLLKPLLIKNSVFVLYGDTAVDYFFVLSGFVLCHRYYDIKLIEIGLFKFMKLRLVRIYPLLFYTTLVYFIVEASVPFIFPGLMSSPNSINDNFKMLTETLLLLNSSPILGIGNGMNYPSWSISAEMISYFIFAITIIAFSKFKYYYIYIFSFELGIYVGFIKTQWKYDEHWILWFFKVFFWIFIRCSSLFLKPKCK
jgi:peptidoglycan/LPS O-acetylase OafA/YrhL